MDNDPDIIEFLKAKVTGTDFEQKITSNPQDEFTFSLRKDDAQRFIPALTRLIAIAERIRQSKVTT